MDQGVGYRPNEPRLQNTQYNSQQSLPQPAWSTTYVPKNEVPVEQYQSFPVQHSPEYYNQQYYSYIGPQTASKPANRPGRVCVTTCANCQQKNTLAQCEIDKLDKEKDALLDENHKLQLKIEELDGIIKQQQEQLEMNANCNINTAKTLQKSYRLSPEATEFNPKKHDQVPVVSVANFDQETVPHKGDKEHDNVDTDEPVAETWEDRITDDKYDVSSKSQAHDVTVKPECNSKTSHDNLIRHKRKGSDDGNKSRGQDSQEKSFRRNDQKESHSQNATNYTDNKFDKSDNNHHQRKGNSNMKHGEEENWRDNNKSKGHKGKSSDDGNSRPPGIKSFQESGSSGGAIKKEFTQRGKQNFNNHGDVRRMNQGEGRGRRPNDSREEYSSRSSKFNQNDKFKSQENKDQSNKNKEATEDIVKEVKGDLFSAPTEYSLAHCVAEDFRMGSGIAVEFKQTFKRTGELLDQNVGVGGCAHLHDRNSNRYIFYMVTKAISSGKPTYQSFDKSLVALREKCEKFGVTKLAIPHLGCGLDRLDWDRVKSDINNIFSKSKIEILAYEFNADGLPEAEGNKPKGPFGVRVVYKIMELKNIAVYTVLIFFGTEDGHLDSTANSLNEKFNFLRTYKSAVKRVGSVCECMKSDDYYIYSLIVQKSFVKNKISFTDLENSCRELNKVFKKENVEFVGLECLSYWSDNITFTEKVVTMLRHTLFKPVRELWVCYRDESEDKHRMCMSYASKQQS